MCILALINIYPIIIHKVSYEYVDGELKVDWHSCRLALILNFFLYITEFILAYNEHAEFIIMLMILKAQIVVRCAYNYYYWYTTKEKRHKEFMKKMGFVEVKNL